MANQGGRAVISLRNTWLWKKKIIRHLCFPVVDFMSNYSYLLEYAAFFSDEISTRSHTFRDDWRRSKPLFPIFKCFKAHFFKTFCCKVVGNHLWKFLMLWISCGGNDVGYFIHQETSRHYHFPAEQTWLGIGTTPWSTYNSPRGEGRGVVGLSYSPSKPCNKH